MLMNARPRCVSHGFETFVPVQRVESLHQRLMEMTNNDINAWNFFRPGANSTTAGWDHSLENFNNNENFPLHSLYSGYYQDTTAVPQSSSGTVSKPQLYTSGYQVRGNLQRSTPSSHSMQQGQATASTCVDRPSPMLSVGYSQWNHGPRNGSFAEFSNAKNGLKNFTYQTLSESDLTPYPPAVPLAPQAAYQEDVSMMTDFSVDTTSPSTAYSSYSSGSVTVDPNSLMSATAPSHQDALMKNTWWSDDSRNSKGQYQDTYGMGMLHDGLPKPNTQQYQQLTDVWNASGNPSAQWATQSSTAVTAPITISPKALTLDVPAPSFSTSASSQGGAQSGSDSSSATSSREDSPDSEPERLAVVEPRHPVRQQRQMLPDGTSRPHVLPVLPSNDLGSRKTSQKRCLKSKSENQRRRKSTPPYSSKGPVASGSSYKVNPVSTKGSPKRIEPKPSSRGSWSESSHNSTEQATHHRDAKDDYLVKSKLAGMSYKDIRRQGNFSEAESTLRGRFRTLTKHKAARVRKPGWTDNDIKLLKKSVRKLTNGSDKNRVPWKQVAEYIANNGGSYHFGNATCRKKWDELQAKGRS